MAVPELIDWLNLLVSAMTLVVFVVSIRFLGRQIRDQQKQIAQQQLQIEQADLQMVDGGHVDGYRSLDPSCSYRFLDVRLTRPGSCSRGYPRSRSPA